MYIRIKYQCTDSLVNEVEIENVYDDFSKNKEMFDFSNYSAKSNNCYDLKALAVGKMKDEMGDVVIEEFAGFKPKVYLILVGDSSKYKKARDVNENVAAKIGQDVFNKKCLRRSMNSKQKSIKFLCLALMRKFIFLIIELIR